jgi:opacity protein-like surface antigen
MLTGLGLTLLLSVPAAAQEDYGRTGWYLGVSGTTAIFTKLDDQLGSVPPQFPDTAPGQFPDVPIEAKPSLGVNARAGYRFLPHFAGEAHLEYLSGSMLAADTHRFQTDITELTALTLTGDLKAYFLTGMIQPFALVGAGWMKTWGTDKRIFPKDICRGDVDNPDCNLDYPDPIDTFDSGGVARVGAGVDIFVTRHVTMGVASSYVIPFGSWSTGFDYNYISIDWGFQYHF